MEGILIDESTLRLTNVLLSIFAVLFLAGIALITYMWQVKGRGLRGYSFPIASQTNGLGPLSNPL